MSNLISNSDANSFVSGIRDLFETFSSTHLLTIVKEPLKTIVNVNDQEYNGYGYQSSPTNYTLTPQSGQWRCMTYEPESWQDETFDPIPNFLLKGDVIFKVETEAKDYIENGKNVLIILDDETYIIVGGPLHKNYLNQNYYYYSLERTT